MNEGAKETTCPHGALSSSDCLICLRGKETPEGKKLNERDNPNGIDIELSWDDFNEHYALNFPQIELNFESDDEPGIHGRKILLSVNPEIAKDIFDHAVELAKTVPAGDAHGVLLGVWEYCKDYKHPSRKKKAA